MAELLTTRQLQEILQVDRTTIYRMADQGRIPAIKVGNQWRFPRLQIEAWLQSQSINAPISPLPTEGGQTTPQTAQHANLAQLLPLECVQLIQDSFADILNVMIMVVDLEGNMLTQPSNPCGLFLATEQSPTARERCVELWNEMAQLPAIMPRFQESHLGLLCARGYVRVGAEITGMLILGGITPPTWPPAPSRLQEIADFLQVDITLLQALRKCTNFRLRNKNAFCRMCNESPTSSLTSPQNALSFMIACNVLPRSPKFHRQSDFTLV
ncbi:MAG: helix-turn-helix domain-containing protein [Chloroflexi bacterium]|nr:helix-turn-helix domain-containing protein [Chloroflexota bacterium]